MCLTGHVPSSAAGLSLIYHGNSCGTAQVIKGDPSNPELGPQAELDPKPCLTGRTGLAKSYGQHCWTISES